MSLSFEVTEFPILALFVCVSVFPENWERPKRSEWNLAVSLLWLVGGYFLSTAAYQIQVNVVVPCMALFSSLSRLPR